MSPWRCGSPISPPGWPFTVASVMSNHCVAMTSGLRYLRATNRPSNPHQLLFVLQGRGQYTHGLSPSDLMDKSMALKATIFKSSLNVADMDRGVYLDAQLTLARHPSETDERMMVRLLAWGLNADPDLEFTKGLCADDEPDIWLKHLHGGRITSYNVCYTKLLRDVDQAYLDFLNNLRSDDAKAVREWNEGVADLELYNGES